MFVFSNFQMPKSCHQGGALLGVGGLFLPNEVSQYRHHWLSLRRRGVQIALAIALYGSVLAVHGCS